jgi:hypothetical protein
VSVRIDDKAGAECRIRLRGGVPRRAPAPGQAWLAGLGMLLQRLRLCREHHLPGEIDHPATADLHLPSRGDGSPPPSLAAMDQQAAVVLDEEEQPRPPGLQRAARTAKPVAYGRYEASRPNELVDRRRWWSAPGASPAGGGQPPPAPGQLLADGARHHPHPVALGEAR